MQDGRTGSVLNGFAGWTVSEPSQKDRDAYLSEPEHTSRITLDGQPPVKQRKITKAALPSRKDVGGKGLFLNLMSSAGVPVPPFKCITVSVGEDLEKLQIPDVIQAHFNHFPHFHHSTADCIKDIKSEINNGSSEQKGLLLKQLANLLKDERFYTAIRNSEPAKTIRTQYQELNKELNNESSDGRAIIVRSSGVAEDSYGDAQAGKYDSEVKGDEDIVRTYLKVIASGYANTAATQATVPPTMPVVMQHCIVCRLGGVAMSYSSLDDHTIQVNSAPGQPKAAVAGDYGNTPDLHRVSRDGKSIDFTPGQFTSVFALKKSDNGDGYQEQAAVQKAETHQSLGPEQLEKLTNYIDKLEDMLMCPVDVEFGVGEDNRLYILQVRPVTRLRGAMKFDIAPYPDSVISGQTVSEGMCSGTLYQAQGPSSPLQDGNIVIADHFYDGMLQPEFLEKARGFIFKKGGLNDHVAITLQQKGIPYALVSEGFDPLESAVSHGKPNEPDTYTLACGEFKGEKGAYLWQGDRTESLKASMVVSATGTDLPQLTSQPPATPDFADPAKGFFWLNGQNNRLLDYFAPGKVFDRCLSKKSVVSMSMAANRSEQVEILKLETERFLGDVDLLLSGYEKLFSFSQHQAETETDSIKRSMEELAAIKARFAQLANEVKEGIEAITSPFGDGELPEQGHRFQGWLDSCQKLSNHLQQLTPPKGTNDINSLHDIVFLVHSAFINTLPAVCLAFGLGEVTKVGEIITMIDFCLSDQGKSKLTDEVKQLFPKLDCLRATAVNLDGALILSAALGNHQCVIENIDQGDGGKGRTVRIKFSDAIADGGLHVNGKLRRMLLIALLIEAMSEKKPEIQLNAITGDLVIVHSHLENADIQESLFLNAASVLFSLSNFDLLDSMNGCTTDLSSISRRIREGLSNEENQNFLKGFLVSPPDLLLVTGRIRFQQLKADYHKAFKQGFLSYASEDFIKSHLDSPVTNDKNNIKNMSYLVAADPNKIVPIIINNNTALNTNWVSEVLESAVAINGEVIKYLDPVPKDKMVVSTQKTLARLSALSRKAATHVEQPPVTSPVPRANEQLQIVNIHQFLQNKNLHLAAVKQNGLVLEYASGQFKNDEEVVLAAVKQNGRALQHASDQLKKNKEMVLTAVKQNGRALQHASDQLKKNKEMVLAAVKQYGPALEYALDPHKKDKEIVLAAVKQHGCSLKYTSDQLINDKEVVLAAVKQHGWTLRYASDQLINDKEVVLAAVKQYGWAFEYASDKLKADKEVVLAAVKKEANALKYASDQLKNDKEVVLAAVKQNGRAFEYASDQLKNDKEVVLAAVKQNGWALLYASDQFKNDNEVVLAAVKKAGRALNYASDQFKNDNEVVLAAVKQDGRALVYASGQFKNDKEMVLAAVKQNGRALECASVQRKKDKEVVLAAVEQNGLALEHASDELKADKEVVLAAVKQNGRALEYALDPHKKDKEVVLAAVKQDGQALVYASKANKADPECAKIAVLDNYSAIKHVDQKVFGDSEFVNSVLY